MTSTGHVYLNKKSIRHTLNTQVAVRNILIAVTFCLVYLLGKHYRPVHPTMYSTVNIKHIERK
jgi:hypothetical protein